MINKIKEPHYEVRCPKCGCHFSFDFDDCKFDDYDVKCPHCSNYIRVVQDNKLVSNIKVRYTTHQQKLLAEFYNKRDKAIKLTYKCDCTIPPNGTYEQIGKKYSDIPYTEEEWNLMQEVFYGKEDK